jgi:hypothetical protein
MDHETDDDHGAPEEQDSPDQVRSALLKALAVVAVIAVLIAVGTVVVVRALGLDDNESPGSTATVPSGGPRSALPSSALPVPGESASTEASESPSASPTPKGAKGDLELDVSPLEAAPMERVNLTGRYRGADDTELQVQRFEEGTWRDFGVKATVRVGVYDTYVMTGRAGEQRFRVWDPAARKGSNVVLVTIG